MNCDSTIAYELFCQLAAMSATAGGTCVDVTSTQRLTFDSYPVAHSLNWMLADPVRITDAYAMHLFMSGAMQDSVTLTDHFGTALQWQRSFAETVSATDHMSYIYMIGREPVDSVTVTDALAHIATTKPFSDAITVPDAVSKHITKVFADTVSMSDSFSNGHSFTYNDGVAATDHGSIYDQSYFDTNAYFLTDYFGYSYSW